MAGSERRAGRTTALAVVVCAVVAALSLATLHPGADGATHRSDGTALGAVHQVRSSATGLRRAGSVLGLAAGASLALLLLGFGSVGTGTEPARSRVERRGTRTRAPPVTS